MRMNSHPLRRRCSSRPSRASRRWPRDTPPAGPRAGRSGRARHARSCTAGARRPADASPRRRGRRTRRRRCLSAWRSRRAGEAQVDGVTPSTKADGRCADRAEAKRARPRLRKRRGPRAHGTGPRRAGGFRRLRGRGVPTGARVVSGLLAFADAALQSRVRLAVAAGHRLREAGVSVPLRLRRRSASTFCRPVFASASLREAVSLDHQGRCASRAQELSRVSSTFSTSPT